jgi:hypothetical protein
VAGDVGLLAAEPVSVITAIATARGVPLIDPGRGADPARLAVKLVQFEARATAGLRTA